MTVRLEFDQATYGPDEPINFHVVVEGEPTSVTRDEVFTGTVTLPGQPPQEVSGAAQVVETTAYGTFTNDHYTVVQDPADPSRYTATPNGG
ncbi:MULTISPECIES: hypothetical protein [unclassified Micromonospora]|uniref:hypothetical protein n=1 Tax=unclassified Micromonospora TaxID=2617518 RepID=UPI0033285235